MERNWNLLGKSYVKALRRISQARGLDRNGLLAIAEEELVKAKRRVQYGGYLWTTLKGKR